MKLRSLAAWFKWTPLHPQWLLGRRRYPKGLEQVAGIVLDVGAADRWVECHLSKSVYYIALDYPATGRELYAARPDVFADGTKLPLRDASIDCVLCLEVAEHVYESHCLLSEISRVLKPGGLLFFSVPFLYPIHDAPHDFMRFTRHGLNLMFDQAGLCVLEVESKSGSIHTAGALACLAITGSLIPGGWRILLLPFAAAIVVTINLSCFILGLAWPNWDAMTFGYVLSAVKPDTND